MRWLRQAAGRVLAGVGGAGMVCHALFVTSPTELRIALVALGGVLFGVATLLPWIKKISAPGVSVETRDDRLQLSADIEDLRESQPEPDSIDLPGTGWWDGARYLLGERCISWLLTNLGGALLGCEARVFLFDATEKCLLPAYRPPAATNPPMKWGVGQGVTGLAFAAEDYVATVGPSVNDGTYGLDDAAQRRFRDLKAVAAAPLYDGFGYVIGTLSISSRSDGNTLATEEGRRQHIALAQQVSVCLADLLGISS